MNNLDKQYIDLLQDILDNGVTKEITETVTVHYQCIWKTDQT
jgi:hypothetical protein